MDFWNAILMVNTLTKELRIVLMSQIITPETLAKVTPALGHVRHAAEQLFADVGVDAINQHHANVCQQKDIEILVGHLNKANIFRFSLD